MRGIELNNGVVIMDVLKASKTYQLQCNQGAPGCTNLRNGDYAATSDTALPDKDKKLGEYCLVEK